jgi:membrane associated rhomboid family serine protease
LRGLRRDWDPDERTELVLEGVFSGLVVVLLLVFVWALFPTTLVRGGTTTNIVAHGSGLLYGVVVSIILIFI